MKLLFSIQFDLGKRSASQSKWFPTENWHSAETISLGSSAQVKLSRNFPDKCFLDWKNDVYHIKSEYYLNKIWDCYWEEEISKASKKFYQVLQNMNIKEMKARVLFSHFHKLTFKVRAFLKLYRVSSRMGNPE